MDATPTTFVVLLDVLTAALIVLIANPFLV
jgi:hypothetical protein